MSSQVVRTAARALAQSGSWPGTYIDTTAIPVDPAALPAQWTAIEFEQFADDPIGIGPASEKREEGQITFKLYNSAGQGDSTSVADADQVLPLIRAHTWPSGFYVQSLSGPLTPDESAQDGFLEMQIQVDYERDHT